MVNSTNFPYSRKLEINIQEVVIRCHILDYTSLLTKISDIGGPMHVATFYFIMSLNMPFCYSQDH
jgi:hypothetical protein